MRLPFSINIGLLHFAQLLLASLLRRHRRRDGGAPGAKKCRQVPLFVGTLLTVAMLFSRGAVATAVLRRSFRPSATSVTGSRFSSAALDRLLFGGLTTNNSTTSKQSASFSNAAPTLHAHSFDEPNPSLFQSDRFAGAGLDADMTADDLVADIAAAELDSLLRSDVRTMGSLLGNIIQERNGKDIFDKVEKLRNLAKVRFD